MDEARDCTGCGRYSIIRVRRDEAMKGSRVYRTHLCGRCLDSERTELRKLREAAEAELAGRRAMEADERLRRTRASARREPERTAERIVRVPAPVVHVTVDAKPRRVVSTVVRREPDGSIAETEQRYLDD